jgi:hypothetical protein
MSLKASVILAGLKNASFCDPTKVKGVKKII